VRSPRAGLKDFCSIQGLRAGKAEPSLAPRHEHSTAATGCRRGSDRLPPPVDVGTLVADYPTEGRPDTAARTVFVRARPAAWPNTCAPSGWHSRSCPNRLGQRAAVTTPTGRPPLPGPDDRVTDRSGSADAVAVQCPRQRADDQGRCRNYSSRRGGGYGMTMTCPGKIRSGLVICGFAFSISARGSPNCWAMPLRVSPGWTT